MQFEGRRIGPPSLEGKRLSRIVTGGLTDSARNDLLSRLPVHEGDILNADSLERVRGIVREFDEHMNVGTGINRQWRGYPDAVRTRCAFRRSNWRDRRWCSGWRHRWCHRWHYRRRSRGSAIGRPDGTKRITIGGNVQQAKLISQPRPVYPPLAKQARISGVVHLAAVIGKEGNVIDLTVISGHPLLIPSAIEAVKNWVYQTTLLNGEPVEVSTQIDVNYTLSDDPIQQ